MKLFNSSKHGQELIIIAAIIAVIAGFFCLKHYKGRAYASGQLACMADCTQINGNFRRYNHNAFSGDQCICQAHKSIYNIWN
jgi:hypothetical protein